MPKRLLQDIKRIPARPKDNGRSGGQKKEPTLKKVRHADVSDEVPAEPMEYRNFDNIENNKGRSEKRYRHRLWGVAAISVLFLLFSFSFIFSGAKVTVSPKIEKLVLNQNFSAVKDGAVNDLPFDLVIISGEESKNVEAGEEKNVSSRAEGVIVIYNAFSGGSQGLNIDTRLEGSNGKIYKTKVATVVPGMKGDVPGSVEVEIYGAEPGAEYNSAPLDFKIFGFKGTPKYSKFYARSKGEIKGGFVGLERQISDSDKANLSSELQATLKAKLSQRAADQIPGGFVLFKDAAILHIDEANFSSVNSTALSNIVPFTIKGTLYGILFEEKALTKKIIEKSFPGEGENEIYIQNIRDLTFSLPAQAELFNFKDIKNINFNLSGTSNAIWKVDEEKLLADIAGKKKKDFNQILSQYPNIISANLSLRPFWRRSLPEKKEDIEVQVNYP